MERAGKDCRSEIAEGSGRVEPTGEQDGSGNGGDEKRPGQTKAADGSSPNAEMEGETARSGPVQRRTDEKAGQGAAGCHRANADGAPNTNGPGGCVKTAESSRPREERVPDIAQGPGTVPAVGATAGAASDAAPDRTGRRKTPTTRPTRPIRGPRGRRRRRGRGPRAQAAATRRAPPYQGRRPRSRG